MYLFLFAKQRLVRPLAPLSALEKLVLLGTLGVPGFAAVGSYYTW
jgi:hypothetical protein